MRNKFSQGMFFCFYVNFLFGLDMPCDDIQTHITYSKIKDGRLESKSSNPTLQAHPVNHLMDVIALSTRLCSHPIQGILAYATPDNFLGRTVDGYSPDASTVCLLTGKAARQLCLVQCALNNQGLGLFIFDALRPLRAVRDFSSWYHQPVADKHEQDRKKLHFPHLEKTDLTRLGYAPDKISRHCFGHAVDLSLIDLKTNQLLNMGTIFDYFDTTSHHPETSSEVIGEEAFHNRELLAKIMKQFGFIAYPREYWHFDYREQELDEPVDIPLTPTLAGLNVADENNRITLESYELGIEEYVSRTPLEIDNFKRWIDQTLQHLPKKAHILEIGSGFGRDAQYIESQGYRVERTDAAEGFVRLLEQKGYSACRFNVLTQDFASSYDGIFANAVFLHFTPMELEKILDKIFAALSEKGILAFSIKNGDGEEWTTVKIDHPRYFCYWRKHSIKALLESKHFTPLEIFEDDKFLQIIAKKDEIPK